MTMVMVPNLTMMLDLKKPSHPPPKAFVSAVSVPINWTKLTLSLFLVAMLISAGYSRPNVEENVDLLEMAPEGVGVHITRLKTEDFTTIESLSRLIDHMAVAASRIQPDTKPNSENNTS